MKKNFLMVASLLIAAMLMVVSCTQEVAPKNDELVEASFSVGFGKDIAIDDYNGEGITYEYSVQPKWSELENGVAPYGAVTDKKIDGEKTISQRVPNQTIGYLTPGLWEVTVKGYKGYTAESKGTLVLEGKKTTYITKDRSVVTVLVYPITVGTAKVSFNLEMQDLQDNNEINIEFYDIEGQKQGGTVVLKDGVNGVSVTKIDGEAAYKYVKGASETDTNVFELPSVGYYTVKVSVPNYNGGYVRTFLATKDSTIAITGSVYPSEFIQSSLNIVSVNVNNATVSVAGTLSDNEKNNLQGNAIKYYNRDKMTFTLNDSNNTYLNDEEVTSLTTKSNVSNIERTLEYKWYINSTEVTTTASVSEGGKKLENTFAPGSYSVSCVITYIVTFTYNDGTNSETKKFKGDAYSKEFIVE